MVKINDDNDDQGYDDDCFDHSDDINPCSHLKI